MCLRSIVSDLGYTGHHGKRVQRDPIHTGGLPGVSSNNIYERRGRDFVRDDFAVDTANRRGLSKYFGQSGKLRVLDTTGIVFVLSAGSCNSRRWDVWTLPDKHRSKRRMPARGNVRCHLCNAGPWMYGGWSKRNSLHHAQLAHDNRDILPYAVSRQRKTHVGDERNGDYAGSGSIAKSENI